MASSAVPYCFARASSNTIFKGGLQGYGSVRRFDRSVCKGVGGFNFFRAIKVYIASRGHYQSLWNLEVVCSPHVGASEKLLGSPYL